MIKMDVEKLELVSIRIENLKKSVSGGGLLDDLEWLAKELREAWVYISSLRR